MCYATGPTASLKPLTGLGLCASEEAECIVQSGVIQQLLHTFGLDLPVHPLSPRIGSHRAHALKTPRSVVTSWLSSYMQVVRPWSFFQGTLADNHSISQFNFFPPLAVFIHWISV